MESSNPDQDIFIQDLKEMVRINEEKCQLKEKQLIDLEKKYNVIKLKLMSIKEKRGDKNDSSGDSPISQESVYKGKLILLRNQLDDSRALVEMKDKENRELLKTLSELKNRMESNAFQVVSNGDAVTPVSSDLLNETYQLKVSSEQAVLKDKHIERLNQKCTEMEQQMLQLNESLKEKDEIIKARNNEIKRLMSQSSNVNEDEQLNLSYNKDTNCEQLKIDKISLEKELNQMRSNLDSKIRELQKERDSLKAEKDKLKDKLSQIIKQTEVTKLTCDDLSRAKESLKCELSELKDNFDKVDASHAAVSNQLSEVKLKLSQEEAKSESLEQKIVSLYKELEEKSNEVNSVHQQITELALKSKTLLCEKDSIINDLENELGQKKNASFSEADEIVEELKQELKEKEAMFGSLQQENLVLKNQLMTLSQTTEEVNRYRTVMGQLQNKLDSCEKELIKYKSLESELNYRVNELETENETLNEEQSKKQSELVSIIQERDEFTEMVKKLNQEKDDAINMFKSLDHEMSILQHLNQKLEEEKSLLIADSRRLENTNQALIEKEEKNHVLQDQLKLQLEDMKKMEDIVIEKEERIKELQQEVERIDNETSIEIKNLNFKMKSEADDLREKLTLVCLEKDSIEEEAKRNVKEAREQLQEAKNKETALKGQLDELVTRERLLNERVSQLQDRLSEECQNKDNYLETCNNYEMSLMTQSQEYIAKCTEFELQLQDREERIVGLVAEKDGLIKKHKELERQLSKLQSCEQDTIKDYQKQIEDLKESNDKINLSMSKINDELMKVKSQLDQELATKQDIVQLNLTLDLIKKDKEHFYNLSEELKKEMEEERREFHLQLTQNQQSWTSTELQLTNRIKSLEKSESDLLQVKSNYVQQLKQVSDQVNQDLKTAQAQIDHLRSVVKSKSDEIEEKSLKIKSLNQICDQFKFEVEQVTNRCKELENVIQDEGSKVQREESEMLIAELRKQIDDYQKELIKIGNDHDKQVNLLSNQVRSLTDQLEEARLNQQKVKLVDTAKIETESLKLQQKCQEQSLKLSEQEVFISNQSVSSKLDQDQLANYESKIGELESVIINQRSEIESLKLAQCQQVEGLRSQIAINTNQFEGERNEWLLQKQQSTNQLNEANSKLERMQQDMLNLQQQLQLQQQQSPAEDEKKPTESKEDSELRLRCKRLAAKLKVKEREVNSLEEKLKEANKSASNLLGYTNDDIMDRERELAELRKKVDQLKFTINNLDLALNKEREKRRACEEELESFWKKSKFTDFEDDSRIDIIDSDGCEPFVLSRLSRARRWLRQKGLFVGSTGHLLKSNRKIFVLIYILFIHIFLIFKCLL